jgi:hypothetical protein
MASTGHQRAKLHHSKFARTEEIGHYRARNYNIGREKFWAKKAMHGTSHHFLHELTSTNSNMLQSAIPNNQNPLFPLEATQPKWAGASGRVRRQRGRTLLKRATHRALT